MGRCVDKSVYKWIKDDYCVPMEAKMSHIAVGAVGERIASDWLQRRGFVLLRRNYRVRGGELDVVMQKDGVVHCFEVKSQTCEANFHEKGERYRPEDHYTPAKHRNIVRAFSAYLQREHSGLETPHALHLVCVEIDHANRRAHVRVVWNVSGV